jgi:hypothetical protein
VNPESLRYQLQIDPSMSVSDYFNNMTDEALQMFKSSEVGTADAWLLPIEGHGEDSKSARTAADVERDMRSFASFVAESRTTESPLCSHLTDYVYLDVQGGPGKQRYHPFRDHTLREDLNSIADTGTVNAHYLHPPANSYFHDIPGSLPAILHSHSDINCLPSLRNATSKNPTEVHWHCLPPISGSCHVHQSFDLSAYLVPNDLADGSIITCHLPSDSPSCSEMESALGKYTGRVKGFSVVKN